MNSGAQLSAFQVPLTVHLLSGCVQRFSPWWVRLGNLETLTLADQLTTVALDRPIYVAGLARSGTTILLELLARHDLVATHRYRDFPGQFVPYWWNRSQNTSSAEPMERAHGDRLQVTDESPEAMEEPLWMAFFPHLHDPTICNVLDDLVENEKFARFYREHLRKLLFVREKSRYVAKGNYNFTRFRYLQKIIPDARFVAVIRNPRDQVASLIKQQQLFCAGERAFPRALAHMQRVGHFEFGLDRRPINVGSEVAEQVSRLWRAGDEVRGTARYWASLYGWFADQLEQDVRLAEATLVVRYEDLCADPLSATAQLTRHCQLPEALSMDEFSRNIAAPTYYTPEFSDLDERIIAEETAAVAARFAYESCLAS